MFFEHVSSAGRGAGAASDVTAQGADFPRESIASAASKPCASHRRYVTPYSMPRHRRRGGLLCPRVQYAADAPPCEKRITTSTIHTTSINCSHRLQQTCPEMVTAAGVLRQSPVHPGINTSEMAQMAPSSSRRSALRDFPGVWYFLLLLLVRAQGYARNTGRWAIFAAAGE